MKQYSPEREQLQKLIATKVVKRKLSSEYTPTENQEPWLFDFRAILLKPEHLNLVTSGLWEYIKEYDNFQIGGLESASIPIVTALVLKAHQEGKKVNGFYIRKSRKKTGLYKNIEGTLNDNPIVLVDDLMNTSSSMRRQIEVLKHVGKKVICVTVIVRFRDIPYYTDLAEQQIPIKSIFTLKDFDLAMNAKKPSPKQDAYKKIWSFAPTTSSYMHVAPRSTPIIDDSTVYFGTDEGYFWALDKQTGKQIWKLKTGFHSQHKNIFSSPALYNNIVLFGSYDGKLYALDKENGKPVWIFTDCEWIGSSPAISADLKYVFVGLEHGHPERRGSVVALDLSTGEKKWEHDMKAFTHASPLYIPEHKQVCCGGNEGVLYILDAESGNLVWKFETEGGQKYTGVGGFSPGDIKFAPAYDADTDAVAFCSMDGHLYVLERKTGVLRFRAHTDYSDTGVRSGIFGSPLFVNDKVLFAALDKHVYCYDKKTGKMAWKYATAGRIFSSPATRDTATVFIGSNDGRLYELTTETGVPVSVTQFPERITNPVVFDKETDNMYIMTNTNELYAMK